jgi:hypothetical protein
MSVLFCFGFSYTAAAFIARYGSRFAGIAGTVRTADKAARIAAQGIGGHRARPFIFGDGAAGEDLNAAIEAASHVVVSIPPNAGSDPALRHYAAPLRRAGHLTSIVYLSTVGVYGDRGGAWVDETTPPNPRSARSTERLQAERQWQDFGAESGRPVAIFRLPGIYGPGRNALVDLVRGDAKRIVKPGQVFNRVHVDDIAQAIDAAFARRANGIFNVCDNEPSPAPQVVTFAADLLGATPPPEILFDAIKDTLSPMALSFYGESKRVRNARMVRELGVSLAYPSYREGLRALHAAGDHLRG